MAQHFWHTIGLLSSVASSQSGAIWLDSHRKAPRIALKLSTDITDMPAFWLHAVPENAL